METLRYVVLANALLAVVSIAYYALLRRETFFGANRLALWLGLAGALLLPLLELPDWRPERVRTVMHKTAQVIVPKVLPNLTPAQPEVTITFPNKKTYKLFRHPQAKFAWSWPIGLVLLYVSGVFVLLIRFGVQLVSLSRLIRQSAHESYDDFTLIRNEAITSPFSFFDWVVLNPNQHAPDELEQILRHERVHVQDRHSLDMLGAELVCIIFWFNPAAYLFRQLLHQTLEFSADRTVLSEGVDAKAYQYNLVKVSMSTGQSAFTNHFSKSQLRPRIFMLNKPESSTATWLKYPVLLIAVLTVASAFARPQHIKALSNYVPKPVTETISAIVGATEKSIQSAALTQQVTDNKVIEPDHDSTSKLLPMPVVLQMDSVRSFPVVDTIRISPSRYMVYQGNYLYWIVTPKTTVDDFAILKHELAKYDCQFQLNEIKYDPLYAYIDRLAFSLVGPNGVQAKVNELDPDDKPIPTYAGYMIHTTKGIKDHEVWASRLNGRFSKKSLLYQTAGEEAFPDILRKVATEDEASIFQFIDDKKMEYLVLEGERKYGHLGIGFRKFDKEEIQKQSSPNSSLNVKPDGSLSVDNVADRVKVFINNEPSTPEAIRKLKIDQLYTVAVILGYDKSTQKRSGVEYLFFYVNEDN